MNETHPMKTIYVKNLGLMAYDEALVFQEKLFNEIIQNKIYNRDNEDKEQKISTNHLLLVQHPHVYTLGKSGSSANLLINQKQLEEGNISFYNTNRGGDITYHGPGQLVVYPILNLEVFFTDIAKYIRMLEETIILTLAEYGIEASRLEGSTGVWLEPETNKARKICAIGVRTSRWVTMHGLAFNVNPDLNYFNNIVPCGITDKAVTSMKQELGKEVNITEVSEKVMNHFAKLFDAQLIN